MIRPRSPWQNALQVFSLPGIPIVPARACRIQAGAGAGRRCLLAGWRAQAAWTRHREHGWFAAGVQGLHAGKGSMLRIYPVVLEVLSQLQPALRRIEVQDRDLARQLRRASSSIALNLGEGMYSRGQNRHARYHTALGSARETLSCLEVAALSSYVEEDKQLWDQLDRVVGTLVLLVRA